ncbi:MAG: hypothetical protein KDD47_28115 [Acidobacteria bacterium]|nr:hypothetical protein [Acidobacteriota bacterium]
MKKKALSILQIALFTAAVAMTAFAFQPAPAQANSEEWCQLNCGGGRTLCGIYVDENGEIVRCRQDLSSCI